MARRVTSLRDSKKQRIVAVDFDGTLCFNKYPFCENPNMELINYIKDNRKHLILILNTCREGQQLQYAVDYMKTLGVEFDYVNENVPWLIEEYGDCRKIYADVYVDNQSMTAKEFCNG